MKVKDFDVDRDIPDLSGKVIIVTGGTDGLGKESVLQLSKHNPSHIYLAARSKSKAETAITEIKSKSPNACPITHLELDLSSFDSIKAAARTFQETSSRLDILMCNAGLVGIKGTTKEGYEMTFGVNHVGHALFIQLLLPTLQKTAKEVTPTPDVRVVILGSEGEAFAPSEYYLLDPAVIKSPMSDWSYFRKYGHSKIANTHYAAELARRYPEATSGVKFVSVHPGAVYTNLGTDAMKNWPTVFAVVKKVAGVVIGMMTVEDGAKNQLWASVAPEVKEGEFYFPVGVDGKGSAKVRDTKKAEMLWDWTEAELKGHY